MTKLIHFRYEAIHFIPPTCHLNLFSIVYVNESSLDWLHFFQSIVNGANGAAGAPVVDVVDVDV